MKQRIIMMGIIFLWAAVLQAESFKTVWRDSGEELHLIRDQVATLTFLSAQQLAQGHIYPKWANIAMAFAGSLIYEIAQANTGHQISVTEVVMTPAFMTLNLFAFPWREKPKRQSNVRRFNDRVRHLRGLRHSYNVHDRVEKCTIRAFLLGKEIGSNGRKVPN